MEGQDRKQRKFARKCYKNRVMENKKESKQRGPVKEF